mgnify:CR=1 FL=1
MILCAAPEQETFRICRFRFLSRAVWYIMDSPPACGVSTGIYESMNLSFTRGDEDASVRENFERFGAAIGVRTSDMVFSRQTHTSNVRIVTEEDRGKGIVCPVDYDNVDGLVTDVPGLCLVTFYADCVPLFSWIR